MKKVWMLLLLVLGGMLFLVGCDDITPDNWNIREGRWEAVGEGIIVKKQTIRGPDCTHEEEKNEDWCNTNYEITLDDGNVFNCGNIKSWGLIREGEKGILYRSDTSSDHKWSWFQWIKDPSYVPEIKFTNSPVYIPREGKDFPIAENSIRVDLGSIRPYIPGPATVYQWKDADVIKPKINTTVLVRRNDGIITTGYVLSNGDWKYDLFRYKTGGGLTATEIEEWKEVDIN